MKHQNSITHLYIYKYVQYSTLYIAKGTISISLENMSFVNDSLAHIRLLFVLPRENHSYKNIDTTDKEK